MTEHQEKGMLARHGTIDVALPPSAILWAAQVDFLRRERNKLIAKGIGDWMPYQRFAFLAGHVRGAKSPVDILKRALAWKQHPAKTQLPVNKLSLLRLTASVENLVLAIQLAEKADG